MPKRQQSTREHQVAGDLPVLCLAFLAVGWAAWYQRRSSVPVHTR